MAIYKLSDLVTNAVFPGIVVTGGSSVTFGTADIIAFDGNTIDAADVTFGSGGVFNPADANTVLNIPAYTSITGVSVPAKTITLTGFNSNKMAATNFQFDNGSKLIIGDGTSGTANDDLNNTLTGSNFNDALYGRGGDDILKGGNGDDILDGGANLSGTSVGDTASYADAISAVTVSLAAQGAGQETDGAGFDTLTGIENLIGSAYNDVLTGDTGKNRLDGGAGADLLTGGAGNDTYVVTAGDVIIETSTGGNDTVEASVDYILDDNLESLILIGSAGKGTGNSGTNKITGNDSANVLDGRGGNDTMVGGKGNDTYYVNASTDVVQEGAGGGTDLVRSTAASYTLGSEVENLRLTGKAAIDGTGNALNNIIYASDGNNTLAGGTNTTVSVSSTNVVTGGDTLSYLYSTGGVSLSIGITTAQTTGGSGSDTAATFENLVGSNYADTLSALSATDGTGTSLALINALTGGYGNDTYIVADTIDRVIELSGQGTDTIKTSASYDISGTTLTAIENLTALGATGLSLTGNTLNNALTGSTGADTLTGGAGNDTLDGGAGTDSMVGGTGNDVYTVAQNTDVVVEAASGGVDTINSGDATRSLSDTGATEVENLTFTGTGANVGSGNTLANVLTGNSGADKLSGMGGVDRLIGNAGNDSLDGGAGADYMIGGAGDDLYVIDASGEVVTEAANEGSDTVVATGVAGFTYTLATNVENLTLGTIDITVATPAADSTGTVAINGTGNVLGNVIIGNAGANSLIGNGGNDFFTGNAGKDVFTGGAGIDTYVYLTEGDSGTITATGANGEILAADITGNTTVDKINSGFKSGTDVIDLSALTGTLTFNATDAFTAAGQVNYEVVGTNTIVHVNTTGATGSEMDIVLVGVVPLSDTDFVLA